MGVHTYVMGNSFPTIYGDQAEGMFGHITHLTTLTPLQQQRWPWMKNKWVVDDCYGHVYGWFDTLKEAKRCAKEEWPSCYFKTPKQFRSERE